MTSVNEEYHVLSHYCSKSDELEHVPSNKEKRIKDLFFFTRGPAFSESEHQ